MLRRTKGIESETLLGFHQCTDEDFAFFAEPTNDSQQLFDLYKNKERKLFCIDWEEHLNDIEIWGAEHDINAY